jgi:hypothetical protein
MLGSGVNEARQPSGDGVGRSRCERLDLLDGVDAESICLRGEVVQRGQA